MALEFVDGIQELDPKRCRATKLNGQQCGCKPITGSTVCRYHGGGTRHVKQAAARRIAIQNARDLVVRLGGSIDVDPLDALLEMVKEAAWNVAAYRIALDELGIHVSSADEHVAETGGTKVGHGVAIASSYDEKGKRDPAAPHILVAMYSSERDRLARYAKMCLDAGVDERRVRIVEAQAQQLGSVVEAAVRSLNPTPDQYREALQAAAKAMRQLTAGDDG